MNSTTQALLEITNKFHFFDITVTCKLKDKVQLPAFKGSTFHGGFGWALKETSENLYKEVFEPKNDSGHTLIKPFVLQPPIETTRDYFPNDVFTFGLKLFGKHARTPQDILVSLFTWQNLGIGSARAKFDIQSIDLNVDTTKLRIFQKKGQPLLMPENQFLGNPLKHSLTSDKLMLPRNTLIFIDALSPIKLQKDGRDSKVAPALDKMLWATAHRLAGLVHGFGNKEDAHIQTLLPECPAENLKTDNSFYSYLDRYSKNQQQKHQLGGLLGSWCYEVDAEIQNLIAWLKLGEIISLGNKTSFGFGSYKLAFGFESQ